MLRFEPDVREPPYCPICGSIDIVAGRCLHCGSEAQERRNSSCRVKSPNSTGGLCR